MRCKMEKKIINPISIRLTKEVSERFKTLAQKKGISQSKLIEILINEYEKVNDESNIVFFLSYENKFLKDSDKWYKKPKKYTFEGRWIYPYQKNYQNWRPAKDYEKDLKDEFKIKESLENYDLYVCVGLAQDIKDNKYVLLETIGLNKKGNGKKINEKPDLWVDRCKYFDNVKEIKENFQNYIDSEDERNIQRVLAEDASKDEVKC